MHMHALALNRDVFRKKSPEATFSLLRKRIVKYQSKLASLQTLHVRTNMPQFLVLLQHHLWISPSSQKQQWTVTDRKGGHTRTVVCAK